MNEQVAVLLEAAFIRGLNVKEATALAGIHRSTYYDYLAKNEDFAKRMWAAKRLLNIKAKQIVYKEISKGSLSTAKWYLSHHDADYGAKVRCDYCNHALRT